MAEPTVICPDCKTEIKLNESLSGQLLEARDDIEKQRLELTWIGKENRPKLEPRILLEGPACACHASRQVSDGTVWLTQRQLAELYQVSVSAIAQHVRNVSFPSES